MLARNQDSTSGQRMNSHARRAKYNCDITSTSVTFWISLDFARLCIGTPPQHRLNLLNDESMCQNSKIEIKEEDEKMYKLNKRNFKYQMTTTTALRCGAIERSAVIAMKWEETMSTFPFNLHKSAGQGDLMKPTDIYLANSFQSNTFVYQFWTLIGIWLWF